MPSWGVVLGELGWLVVASRGIMSGLGFADGVKQSAPIYDHCSGPVLKALPGRG